nr:hypothetical protein [Tanacetum cinerariifolium]
MDTSKSLHSSKFSKKPFISFMDNSKRNNLETGLTIVECDNDVKKYLTFDEAHEDIQSKVTSHEKLKSHENLALMAFDESCTWGKEQSISPLLRTPPLKKRRKGIAFQGNNLYADFLHADCVDGHFDVLDHWSCEDVYGGGCFDIKDEFENEVILDDVVSSLPNLSMLLKRKDTKQKITGIKDVEDLQVRIEKLEEIFSYLSNRKLKQKEVIVGTDDETSSKDDTSSNDEISSSEDLINYLSALDVEWQLPKNTQEEPPKPHFDPIKTEAQQVVETRLFVNQIREEAQTSRNMIGQLAALVAEMEAFDDPEEVFDTLMGLRDDIQVEEAKLAGLSDLITHAEEEIEMKEA